MKLFKFSGGLSLLGHKSATQQQAIQTLPMAKKLILPTQQHIGIQAVINVSIGDKVLKGECIACAPDGISASVHAPTSGTVIAIEEHDAAHPSGLTTQCIVIETDGLDQSAPRPKQTNPLTQTPLDLLHQIQHSGIVGLGGAGFPGHIKLKSTQNIETLIINGAECEPYITCDDRLMQEQPEKVIQGALLIAHIVSTKHCLIAVEDNKTAAFNALQNSLKQLSTQTQIDIQVEIVKIPTRYPAGGEKQLIQVLTNKQVPSSGLPADIGIICVNSASSAAIYDAIYLSQPLISRVVTVTGKNVANPANLNVLLGTPIADLLDYCQVAPQTTILMGGPMMGFPLTSRQVPVVKTMNCLLSLPPTNVQPRACIRCGECARSCPMNLLPQQLYWFSRGKNFNKAQQHALFDCIECGCCDYVCPSDIPLVQYFRAAKADIREDNKNKQKAIESKLRFDARNERLQRDKREREEKRRAHKAKLQASKNKKTIDDAVNRVKNKKQQVNP